MRGFLSFGRSLINEVREFGLPGTIANLVNDHLTGRLIFISVPFTRFSASFEWREQNLGWAIEKVHCGVGIWVGRIEANLCREPKRFIAQREAH